MTTNLEVCLVACLYTGSARSNLAQRTPRMQLEITKSLSKVLEDAQRNTFVSVNDVNVHCSSEVSAHLGTTFTM